jgi:hypothetical protein
MALRDLEGPFVLKSAKKFLERMKKERFSFFLEGKEENQKSKIEKWQTSQNSVWIFGDQMKNSFHLTQHLLNPLTSKQDGVVNNPELQWQESFGICQLQ